MDMIDMDGEISREMKGKRPLVTVSYAQSIDGSIARVRGVPLRLSSHQSMVMTHQLRAAHSAILVGVGTVLADDPRLTVRHVDGANPRPVILDSKLRCPPTAKVMAGRPIIATTEAADEAAAVRLRSAGATVVRVGCNQREQVDLAQMLIALYQNGVQSVMVEGGARTISSFFAAQWVDQVVITIAPVFVGGLNVMDGLQNDFHLVDVTMEQCGGDIIVRGNVRF